ncbi:unnamed protein product [Dicrocoelium dendriticum]|nr:unnamed protein product [Dicrocoelium dendriticum]
MKKPSLIVLFLAFSVQSNILICQKDGAYLKPFDSSEDDRINFLPGLSRQPAFGQFSGYLTGSSDNFQLHYWFIEASENSDRAPLILWLNGGPGCSSMEGLLDECGPFKLVDAKHLEENLWSWNKFANILYLESPVGVGFSYSKDGNVTSDDDMTSLNTYHALLNFLEKFPAYKKRDFYITGESYGGVYIPSLATRILKSKPKDLILKGIAVGNGLNSYRFNDNSLLYFIYYHGLIDESLWNSALAACCGSQCASKCMFTDNNSLACQSAVSTILVTLSGLDLYNLYSKCAGGVPTAFSRNNLFPLHPTNSGSFRPDAGNLFRSNIVRQALIGFTRPTKNLILPCVDDSVITDYLNSPAVMKAIHVTLPPMSKWALCSEEVYANYVRTYTDMSDHYQLLLDAKIRVLVYYGDTDMACNYLGGLWFVDNFNFKLDRPMEHWLFEDLDKTNQVGGVHKVLKSPRGDLWYATIRGAGHMVPRDQPVAMYHLITSFISGKEL